MTADLEQDLVIGVSSTALFDLRTEHEIFLNEGVAAYSRHQIEHEDEPLRAGTGFPLVQKLLRLNEVRETPRRVTILLMSRNSADTSLRIFRSLDFHGLQITRAVLTSGTPLSRYLKAFHVDLFLSTHEPDVEEALRGGTAAALIYGAPETDVTTSNELRVAFDGDAVLFSEEAEAIFQERGLEAFLEHERCNAKKPLPDGPFAKLFRDLALIQSKLPPGGIGIRTALITARDAPAHERVIRTLRAWQAHVDEAFFLGGLHKDAILEAFRPHIFFDDHSGHCDRAARIVPTGRVPAAVRRRPKDAA